MWGQTPDEMFQRRNKKDQTINDMHNVAFPSQFSQDATAVNTPHRGSSDEENKEPNEDGTWGERDVGGPVDHREAMLDYEDMRQELTRLSIQRTKSRAQSHGGAKPSALRTLTASTARRRTTRRDSSATVDTAVTEDVEANAGAEDEEPDFDMGGFLKDGHFEKRVGGRSAKRVGVVYRNLTVKGVGASMMFTKSLPEAIIGTFEPDLYRLVTRFVPKLNVGKAPPVKILLKDFTGSVQDGEMMLVLGRPGSGCSTFLKVIANQRDSYASVEGDVTYGGLSAEDQKKRYKGEVNYNPEDDQHLPNLTVWQTLRFALMNKTRKHEAGSIP
ncbi:ATP-binding cassette transporter snq2, partial [Elasticomyces elasticus]